MGSCDQRTVHENRMLNHGVEQRVVAHGYIQKLQLRGE
jgi:hypothetical protein